MHECNPGRIRFILTQQIKALEEEFDCQLFEGIGKST